MKFYTGVHGVHLARHIDRAFISVNILRSKNRQSYFEVGEWIMDSGAFTEISNHGHFRYSVEEYAGWINKFAGCGKLELAVAQDYMCEPFILKITGHSVPEHQRLTVERYDALLPLSTVTVMPVLQGYQPEEYACHVDMYGERLKNEMRVGVGSVCKRNADPAAIVAVLEAVKKRRPDLRLHGFGLKTTALQNAYIMSMLYSADSMAWSFAARKQGRDANSGTEAANFTEVIRTTAGRKPFQLELCK